MGTTTSAITYARRLRPDLPTALPMATTALVGALVGAVTASRVPAAAFQPIIVGALVAVLVVTVARPRLGQRTALRWTGARQMVAAGGFGLVIGAYDGLLGPGTGTFLVMALVGVLGYAFLPATALAKIVNVAANVGALVVFVPGGHVIWRIGLVIGAANLAGGYLGARMAVAKGSRFVRIVFVAVALALILRLGYTLVTR
jgi:uncharacterized membrane protein YfcA